MPDLWTIGSLPDEQPVILGIMTGTLALIGGVLQLTVPSYALRLVRRYGAERVGWFVVIAFSSLALLHVVSPLNLTAKGAAWDGTTHLAYAIGSVLLLIGMGHIETIVSERERVRCREEVLAQRPEQTEEEGSELARANVELTAELARRDQLERALIESEAQYRLVFTENPQPMWIFDVRTSQFLAVNNAALRQYGFTPQEFSALTVRDLLPGSSVGKFLQYVAECCAGGESRGHWQHCRKDGTPIDVEISATDITYAGVPARLVLAEDIGQRHRLELQSRQRERTELLGRLASGIADHFNNMLTVIQGHTSVLLKKANEASTAEQLNQISSAASRASALAQRLLITGGRYPVQLQPLDLNGLIRDQSQVLHRLVGEQIVIEKNFGSFLAPTLADRYLTEHILVNLVLNARDAMPNGGCIIISTAILHLDEAQVQGNDDARAGEFVRLGVRDTGCGLAPELRSRLFEPFAIAGGKGMGLGLAGVYGAVRQLSGWIEYTTEVGVGTEMRVFLPAAPAAEVLAQIQAKPAAPVVKGTILLIEPEEKVRRLARCILNWNDYKVIEAEDSATALLLWDGQASKIDLLLTDIHLSGDISGRELANRFQELKPGLKVIYTCNASLGKDKQLPPALERQRFISKPYTPDKLMLAVESYIGRS